MPGPYRIDQTFVHLEPQDGATTLAVTPAFWQQLGEGRHPQLEEGRLVSHFVCDADWPSWEMHPAGEEIVMLLSGAVDLVLELPEGPSTLALSGAGSYALVPRGVWHTANVRETASMFFVTPGRDTQHRPR